MEANLSETDPAAAMMAPPRRSSRRGTIADLDEEKSPFSRGSGSQFKMVDVRQALRLERGQPDYLTARRELKAR